MGNGVGKNMRREKTDYPGDTYRLKKTGEKVFYIRYRRGGHGTPLIKVLRLEKMLSDDLQAKQECRMACHSSGQVFFGNAAAREFFKKTP